jgi:hypothetical protein
MQKNQKKHCFYSKKRKNFKKIQKVAPQKQNKQKNRDLSEKAPKHGDFPQKAKQGKSSLMNATILQNLE